MKQTTKTVFRIFGADEVEKEEQFLTRQSAEGWHLASVKPPMYTFRRGAPETLQYRVDMPAEFPLPRDYYQTFQDAGWEFVGSLKKPVHGQSAWQYFRKAAGPGESPELYTDRESRLEALYRHRRFALRSIALVTALAVLAVFTSAVVWRIALPSHISAFLGGFLTGMGLAIVLSLFSLFAINRKIRRE